MAEDHVNNAAAPARKYAAKQILRESVLIGVLGAFLAFAANAISPRGLVLTRNYFPSGVRSSQSAVITNSPTLSNASPRVVAPAHTPPQLLAARLQAKGLQLADSNQVIQLFGDPRYEQELVIFVDARDDRHYQEGHIPGAYQFDHYRAENYLPIVLPVCQTAQQIVVYCMGGDCEDSEFAAITLASTGIPMERFYVYGGGMSEWMTNGLPVEVGERKSGKLLNTQP